MTSINYTITKATDEVASLIFKETWSTNLRGYEWKYKDQIKQRHGHNLVPLVLRAELASLIAGNTVTPTFKANYLALGSSATPPTNADTQLWSETLRGLFTDRRAVDNIAYLDKFFWSVEVGGNNYNEVGVFVDGTGVANTWFLLSRININETMQALESLTINVTITIV